MAHKENLLERYGDYVICLHYYDGVIEEVDLKDLVDAILEKVRKERTLEGGG
jgi:hypothetical protein